MRPLDLQSERYSPTGNLASVGVLNQLGRPVMDRLTLMLREAVQNSWDARVSQTEPVRFGLTSYLLNDEQRDLMLTTVFCHVPDNLGLRKLAGREDSLGVLVIHDRGTSGLGGPTRADVPVKVGEHRD